MSIKAINKAFQSKLSGNVKLVLLALADCADDNLQCFPSYNHISKKASISISTAKRIVKKLEEMQVLKKQNRFIKGKKQQTSNIYTLTIASSKLALTKKAKNDTTIALQYNEEANRLAKESNYNKELLQTLDFYTELKPKEGLKYAKEYIKISDSLQQQERLTRNKLARIEFETDEIIVEKEAISNRFRIILISSLLIISFGILFYIILYQRSKHRELLFSQEQQMANEEIYKLMLDKQDELEEAKKKEQLRISQDLHDNILNKLASIRFNLFALTQKPDETVIKRSIEYIDKIQSVESEIRTVAHELNFESFLNKGNFKSILEQLLQNQKETYDTICESTISSDEAIESLSALVKMNIYRIIQETLNNINKHAKATLISITLSIDEGFLYLSIKDNGVGFKVSKLKSGIGLKNMESRAVSINGRLKISSEINNGTKVSLKVKL